MMVCLHWNIKLKLSPFDDWVTGFITISEHIILSLLYYLGVFFEDFESQDLIDIF